MKIKKQGFLPVISLLVLMPFNAAWSQFGIKGGLAVSGFQLSQDVSPSTGNDYRPFLGYEIEWIQEGDASSQDRGLQIGIFYAKDFSKYFAVQPELFYSQKGLHIYQAELYNSAYSLNVDYIAGAHGSGYFENSQLRQRHLSHLGLHGWRLVRPCRRQTRCCSLPRISA